jgi:two-component system, LytTR family, response regulator
VNLRTAIADDEPLARERLRFLLGADPEVEIIADCCNGPEVVATLKANRFDLLFLDIQMPGKNGFEVIEEVGIANMPITIFITAHNEFAVEAFKVSALDYLVKPVERRRLHEALSRAKERVQLQQAFASREQVSSLLKAMQTSATRTQHPQRFLAKNGNTESVVSVEDIEWIEAADYYVCLHAGGKQHLLRESIRSLESRLDPNKFVRLHRSAIVNIDHVREIHRDGRTEGWVLLSSGIRVRLNKSGWHRLAAMSGTS